MTAVVYSVTQCSHPWSISQKQQLHKCVWTPRRRAAELVRYIPNDATGNKRWWHDGQLIDSHLISDPVDSALSLHLFRFFYLQFQAKWHAVGGTDPRLVPTVNVLRITKPAPIVSQVMLGRAVTQPHRESPISRPRRTGPPNCYPLLWQWGAILFISNSHHFQLSKDISL